MLVYGDRTRTIAPRVRLAQIEALLRRPLWGQARHDGLVHALIEAGELAQALADAEFERNKVDDHTPLQAAALRLVEGLARKVDASWRSGFEDAGPNVGGELAALGALAPPGLVRGKEAEGFAHYAVYPECYLEAARELAGSAPLVIGLRSIGITLGAAVAAATDASGFISLRPHGHPFDRHVSVSDDLRRMLATHQGVFAVVDEGPGLSGSSFGAAADLLRDLGVEEERLVFMPSHGGGPGPHAPARHRARWSRVRRLFRTLDDIAPPAVIGRMFEDIIGPSTQVEDHSCGAWRADVSPGARPPAWPALERRKFRLTTSSGDVFMARFAGLGALGEEKMLIAGRLFSQGFVAEPLALRRGFLLERWIVGRAVTWPETRTPAFRRNLAAYLAFRAAHLPAERPGAAPDELAHMALANTEEALGCVSKDKVAARLKSLDVAAQDLRPVCVDGRLHAWEWRVGADGAIRKTDALDHAFAHDLVGSQDPAWDVAGAAVEFQLSTSEVGALTHQVDGVSSTVVDLFTGLYSAFQAGVWTMAADTQQAEAAAKARGQASRYLDALRRWAEPG